MRLFLFTPSSGILPLPVVRCMHQGSAYIETREKDPFIQALALLVLLLRPVTMMTWSFVPIVVVMRKSSVARISRDPSGHLRWRYCCYYTAALQRFVALRRRPANALSGSAIVCLSACGVSLARAAKITCCSYEKPDTQASYRQNGSLRRALLQGIRFLTTE